MTKMKISSSGGSFQDPELGTFAGCCVRIIDLGTQTNEFEGKKTTKRQLMLGWELHGDSVDSDASGYMTGDDGRPDPNRPFLVSAFLTASFHPEATLRKYMESWRGVPFTEEQIHEYENEGFDWSVMLGKPCMVNMGPNKNGKIRVRTVSRLQKNIERPVPVNPLTVFMLDEFDLNVFNSLPEGIRNMIATSPEYRAATHPMGSDLKGSPVKISDDVPFDDDIPF